MMFYTHLFTSARGHLAKIWLAAHWERKLTRAQVFECNLELVIEDIISPKMRIGLRTSGHLLFGVVRIYSRKAKYLLADCGDALLRVKAAFRPGQTDLAADELEAERKAITLTEDFTAFEDVAAFDAQLPELSDTDMADHLSLNQSRTEDITLKEDLGNEFLTLVDFGDESQINHPGLLDMSLQSLSHHGDAFGDEGRGFDLLDFLTNASDECTGFITAEPPMENPSPPVLTYRQDALATSLPSETTLLAIEEKGFALEPVPITPNSEKKRGKRKRKLIVDQNKELSDAYIKEQISDFSELVGTMDLAPPTLQLMLWKENGGAHSLFARPCSPFIAPQIFELFSISGNRGVHVEVEELRQGAQEGRRETSVLTTSCVSIADSSPDPDTFSRLTDPLELSSICAEASGDGGSALAHPELPSEDSTLVHPFLSNKETHLSSLSNRSAEESRVFEEVDVKRRAQKLLECLKNNGSATVSLKSLCDGVTRSQAATTFFCLLVLSKQKRLHLRQDAPYQDILIRPGPTP